MNNTLRCLTGDIAIIVLPIIDAPDDPNDIPSVVSALAVAGAPTYRDVAAAQACGWVVVGEVVGDDSVVVFLREGIAALRGTRTPLPAPQDAAVILGTSLDLFGTSFAEVTPVPGVRTPRPRESRSGV